MKHRCTTQLAKLSFNHSIGCAHSLRFSTFLKVKISRKRILVGVLCVVVIYLCNISFFFIPCIILAVLSLSLSVVVTKIRGHIAGPPPPFPLRHVPSFLSREEFSIFFPRRLASNCTYPRCLALSTVDPFFLLHFCK